MEFRDIVMEKSWNFVDNFVATLVFLKESALVTRDWPVNHCIGELSYYTPSQRRV